MAANRSSSAAILSRLIVTRLHGEPLIVIAKIPAERRDYGPLMKTSTVPGKMKKSGSGDPCTVDHDSDDIAPRLR